MEAVLVDEQRRRPFHRLVQRRPRASPRISYTPAVPEPGRPSAAGVYRRVVFPSHEQLRYPRRRDGGVAICVPIPSSPSFAGPAPTLCATSATGAGSRRLALAALHHLEQPRVAGALRGQPDERPGHVALGGRTHPRAGAPLCRARVRTGYWAAMSQANMDVVREAVDAVNRRDPAAFTACLHPDVEWDDAGGFGTSTSLSLPLPSTQVARGGVFRPAGALPRRNRRRQRVE